MPSEPWSRIECEAIVADYFAMLAKECRNETYNKSSHRQKLQQLLNNRSDGSIEYKHQNISAVLIRAGQLYIRGYKPAWNYQTMLEQVVLDQLEQRRQELEILEEIVAAEMPQELSLHDWQSRFVEPPDPAREIHVRAPRAPRLQHVNYAEREARNRSLGEGGERFVLEVERHRLAAAGRADLVNDVEWVSKLRGDGAGYDIRSFNGVTDEELFIEVKTTNSGKYQPFFISSNEVTFSTEHAESYSLYRVFGFSRNPSIFRLDGVVDDHVRLSPRLYSAEF